MHQSILESSAYQYVQDFYTVVSKEDRRKQATYIIYTVLVNSSIKYC